MLCGGREGVCPPPHLWDSWTALPQCYTICLGLILYFCSVSPHPTGKRLYINKWGEKKFKLSVILLYAAVNVIALSCGKFNILKLIYIS